ALTDVLVERPRPEGAFDDDVRVVEEVRREDPREVVGHPRESTTLRAVSHGCSNRSVVARVATRRVGQTTTGSLIVGRFGRRALESTPRWPESGPDWPSSRRLPRRARLLATRQSLSRL